VLGEQPEGRGVQTGISDGRVTEVTATRCSLACGSSPTSWRRGQAMSAQAQPSQDSQPLIRLRGITKVYGEGWPSRRSRA
jgi:hypothetical protein